MLASHGIDSFGPYYAAADRFMNRSDHLSELMTLRKRILMRFWLGRGGACDGVQDGSGLLLGGSE